MAKKAPALKPSCSPMLDDITEYVKQATDAIPDPKMVSNLTANMMVKAARKEVTPSDVMVSGIINSLLSGTGTAVANSVGIVFKGITEPLIEFVRRSSTSEEVARIINKEGNEQVIKAGGPIQAFVEVASG